MAKHLSIFLLLASACIDQEIGPRVRDKNLDPAQGDDAGLDASSAGDGDAAVGDGDPGDGDGDGDGDSPDSGICGGKTCSGFGMEHLDEQCECVPCQGEKECPGSLICADGKGCVECTSENTSECPDDRPVCTAAFHCVQCNDNEDCAGTPGTPVCDPTSNTCVPCDAEHACNSNRLCIEAEGPDKGRCVGCTPDDRRHCARDMDGDQDVCNALTLECQPGVKDGTGKLCGSKDASCVSSAQCPTGSACVQEVFEGQLLDAWLCMPLKDSVSCKPPFVELKTRSTIEGVAAEVCSLRISTCAAHAQYSNTSCVSDTDDTQGDDTKCGMPGVADGYCVDKGLLGWRCTVACKNDVSDCPVDSESCLDEAPHAGGSRDLCEL